MYKYSLWVMMSKECIMVTQFQTLKWKKKLTYEYMIHLPRWNGHMLEP